MILEVSAAVAKKGGTAAMAVLVMVVATVVATVAAEGAAKAVVTPVALKLSMSFLGLPVMYKTKQKKLSQVAKHHFFLLSVVIACY